VRHLQSQARLAHNSIILVVSHVKTFYHSNGFEIHSAMPISAGITKEAELMDKTLALNALQMAEPQGQGADSSALEYRSVYR
jgi:predicted N-acetyltransferase YhbS